MTTQVLVLPAPVRAILRRLEENGHRAWAVGGCVRDSLLGRPPGDWDLCTTARPEQTLAAFPEEKTVLTGLKHGTVTVLWQGRPYEITTLRAESGYADHRHPDRVEFVTSLPQDLARRDLTINAMACGLDGRLVDPYGGQRDLAAGLVRCVGRAEQRFAEDALRILRALRFAAQLGFALEPGTAQAAQAQAGLLGQVSAERLYAELDKLLAGPAAAAVLARYPLVLAAVIPEIAPAVGFDQKKPEFFTTDVWGHTVEAFAHADPGERLVRWALLLHDLGKPETFVLDAQGQGWTYGHEAAGERIARQVLERLRADKATRQEVCLLVAHHGDVPALTQAQALDWLHRYGPQTAHRLVQVKRCDLLGRVQSPRVQGFLRELDDFSALLQQAAQTGCWRQDQLALTGRDLLAAGLPAGPALGSILAQLLRQVMEGRLPNQKEPLRTAALALAAQKKNCGGAP